MAVHFFHCTDGVSFFADQQGLSVTREDEIFPAAMRTAEQVMQHLPSISDWSGWLVCVHDELGQMVEVFDFPSLHLAVDAGFTSQHSRSGPSPIGSSTSFELRKRGSPVTSSPTHGGLLNA